MYDKKITLHITELKPSRRDLEGLRAIRAVKRAARSSKDKYKITIEKIDE